MAITLVDVGTTANDGTGDPLRTAFQTVNTALTRLDNTVDVQTGYVLLKDDSGSTGVAVTTAGDVGIGTTSPNYNLHVRDTTAQVAIHANSLANPLLIEHNANGNGSILLGSAGKLTLGVTNGSGTDAVEIVTKSTVRFTVDDDGYVGIGTTLPQKTLEVAGSGFNAAIRLRDTAAGNFCDILAVDNTFRFYTAAAERARLNATGLGIGTTNPLTMLHIASATGPFLRLHSTDTTIAPAEYVGGVEFFSSDASAGVVVGGIRCAAIDSGTKFALEFLTRNTASAAAVAMTIKEDGVVNIANLPTSSTGLATGDIWNDGGTLKVA